MKVRSGFISNSSTTSFVIVIDTEKQPYLVPLLQGWTHYETEIVSTDKKEIISKIMDREHEDISDKLENVTDGGKFIAVLMYLSYHDDVITHYIHQNGVKFVHSLDY